MKDFETSKEILGAYVVISNLEGKSVTLIPETLSREMSKHLNDYYSKKRGLSPEEFHEEYLKLTYEARDIDHNWVARMDFPLPRNGRSFPKTIEHFLEQEKIKIN